MIKIDGILAYETEEEMYADLADKKVELTYCGRSGRSPRLLWYKGDNEDDYYVDNSKEE